MMPAHDHCSIPQCSNCRITCPDLSFHKMPRDKNLRMCWLVAIECDVGEHFNVTSLTVVCGAHFTAADFATGLRQGSDGTKSKTRRLKHRAVPFVFAWRPFVSTRPARSTMSPSVEATSMTEAQALHADFEQVKKHLVVAQKEVATL